MSNIVFMFGVYLLCRSQGFTPTDQEMISLLFVEAIAIISDVAKAIKWYFNW